MAFSPFQVDLDGAQGRHPTEDAPAGDYVLELGHANLQSDYLEVGDYIEYSQAVSSLPAYIKRIRFQVRIQAPTALPSSRVWVFSARLNGTILYERSIPGAVRKNDLLVDGCLPLADATYISDTVAFRLELT